MIFLPLLSLASVMEILPCEYVVDFGPVAVPFKYKMVLEFQARDGTALEVPITLPAEWDPKGTQESILSVLKDNRWVARPGPGTSLVVVGTKKGSPVKSVTVKSEAAVPTIRWVPVPPTKQSKK